MGRARLEPGELGEVTVTPVRRSATGGYEVVTSSARSSHYRARLVFRDWNGVKTEVKRVATSRGAAEQSATEAARRKLAAVSATHLDASTLIVKACAEWLSEHEADRSLAPRTLDVYRSAHARAIASDDSTIRGLTVGQANDAQVLHRFLADVKRRRGLATAKHAKAVLSGVLKQAAEFRVIPTNEMLAVRLGGARNAGQAETSLDATRAFTVEELERVRSLADERAREPAPLRTRLKHEALSDLVHVLSGTGMRIGEALELKWADVNVQLPANPGAAPPAQVCDVGTREAPAAGRADSPGYGRIHVRGTKTASADRVVNAPTWLCERLRERRQTLEAATSPEAVAAGLVFPAPALLAADPSTALCKTWDAANCQKAMRALLDAAGCGWATSHDFRRTVITRLYDARVPPHRVADLVGHSDPSFTARVYLGRDAMGDKADIAALL